MKNFIKNILNDEVAPNHTIKVFLWYSMMLGIFFTMAINWDWTNLDVFRFRFMFWSSSFFINKTFFIIYNILIALATFLLLKKLKVTTLLCRLILYSHAAFWFCATFTLWEIFFIYNISIFKNKFIFLASLCISMLFFWSSLYLAYLDEKNFYRLKYVCSAINCE